MAYQQNDGTSGSEDGERHGWDWCNLQKSEDCLDKPAHPIGSRQLPDDPFRAGMGEYKSRFRCYKHDGEGENK